MRVFNGQPKPQGFRTRPALRTLGAVCHREIFAATFQLGRRSQESKEPHRPLSPGAFVITMATLKAEVQSYCAERRIQCTGNGSNGCQLLEHLTAMNELLLETGLQIEEDSSHPGGVRMAVSRTLICNNPMWDKPRAWLKNSSLKLAETLILDHCCFTAMETYSTMPWPYSMRRALAHCRGLKSFTVHMVQRVDGHGRDHLDIFRLLHSLKTTVKLVFKSAYTVLHSSTAPIEGSIPQSTLEHVTTLRAEHLILTPPHARELLRVLLNNHTITDLGVHACVFARGPGDCAALFRDYLSKRRAQLRKLTLADHLRCGDQALWTQMAHVISKVSTLEELDVFLNMENEIYPAVLGAFARVARQCEKLQRLRLPGRRQVVGVPLTQLDDTQTVAPWLNALQKTRALRELRIHLSGMTDAQCRNLFLGIAGNGTLDNVVIEDDTERMDLETPSNLIQELGLCDRVRFGCLVVTNMNSAGLSEVAALSSISCNGLVVRLHSWHPMEPLLEHCKMLTRRGATTTLHVRCALMSQPAFDALLSWLAGTSALTDIRLDGFTHAVSYRCEECADMCSKLVSALAANRSIAAVCLLSFALEAEHLRTLCEGARIHHSLTEIRLIPPCQQDFQRCLPEKQQHWTEGYHVAAAQLQDVVRRNASRIAPAVEFVLGKEIAAAGAMALEDLRDHPRVVEQVREEAHVKDAEAAVMVKQAVSDLRNMDVHDYLWLTGVVRERPAMRLDAGCRDVHFLGLPLECWLPIRRYLKIADVASS
ncbi:hypothetical protein HPB50_014217 [Hyalomma asiaticum]|uniref:Uncharacterized protein n=1 Tax=Hyalomma asiaticum TaxID=266040 RepID=A0ACB7TAK4_HYAAI|nr:hypothetical protein HPB50_014217 [Hyalomma asiaticum]